MSRRRRNPATGRTGTRTRVARICQCGHPTRDGAYVCDCCLDGLASDLRELLPAGEAPGLWADLGSVIAGERGVDYRALGGGSGGSEETGIVLDEVASRRAANLRRVLRRLVVGCMANHVDHTAPAEWAPRAASEVPAMVEWLLWRIDAMAWHPEFATAPHHVQRAVDAARWSVMPAPFRQWLGACRIRGCDGAMFARRDDTFATCDRCDAYVEAAPLRDRLIGELEDRLCTAAQIAELYDPEPTERERIRKRINQWAHRGRLLGWPRACTWTPGACAWPAPAPGRNLTGSEDLVFRFGDAFDLLVQHDLKHDDYDNDTAKGA